MDSKKTLINPDERNIQLVFSKNSILNANLLINGQICYIVSTTDRHTQKTKIIDAITNSEVVHIQKRTLLPDKIVFANRNGGVDQKLSDVMKTHKMDDGYKAHMIQTPLGDFYWKMHKIHRLAFYSTSDPVEPVAYRESITHPINTFALVVRKDLEGILDYIIPTFLFLESGMRSGEKQAVVAEGIASENRVLLGNYVNVNTLNEF